MYGTDTVQTHAKITSQDVPQPMTAHQRPLLEVYDCVGILTFLPHTRSAHLGGNDPAAARVRDTDKD